MDIQATISGTLDMINRSLRILSIARKPDNEEFSMIAKITGAGMVGMGLLGLIISFAFRYI